MMCYDSRVESVAYVEARKKSIVDVAQREGYTLPVDNFTVTVQDDGFILIQCCVPEKQEHDLQQEKLRLSGGN